MIRLLVRFLVVEDCGESRLASALILGWVLVACVVGVLVFS